MTEVVRIEGLQQMRDALMRKIPLEMQGKVLQRALAAGGRVVVAAARQKAPRKTGRMAKAVFSGRDKRNSVPTFESRSVGVRRGKKRNDPNGAYYWKFVEFGHKTRLGSKKHGPPKMVKARPFLRPAFDESGRQAAEAIKERLGVEIEKAAKKAAWK